MYQKRLISITVLFTVLIFACGKDDEPVGPSGPSSTDREKFIGNWAGTYECGNPPADTMFIAIGSGDLDLRITLHAQAINADAVDGELTDVNIITIPEQTIAGFPGSGKITYSNNVLSLSQEGFGITCNGTNYAKF